VVELEVVAGDPFSLAAAATALRLPRCIRADGPQPGRWYPL